MTKFDRSNVLLRYADSRTIYSHLQKFDDLCGLVESLSSRAVLRNLLVDRHGLNSKDAQRRAALMSPYLETAFAYIDQSQNGPSEVSFLPTYYAILNLAKVYILAGPLQASLSSNRFHGATYREQGAGPKSFLSERVVIKKTGTIPLFYETLTGQKIQRDIRVPMSLFYSHITSIGAEYFIASGKKSGLAPIRPGPPLQDPKNGALFKERVAIDDGYSSLKVSRANLKLFRNWRRVPRSKMFESPFIEQISADDPKYFAELRPSIHPALLYGEHDVVLTPISANSILLPEELPILMAYFHMSNVARYKPDYLAYVRQSQHWPILAALRNHGLYKFMNLFWSFMRQENFEIRSI